MKDAAVKKASPTWGHVFMVLVVGGLLFAMEYYLCKKGHKVTAWVVLLLPVAVLVLIVLLIFLVFKSLVDAAKNTQVVVHPGPGAAVTPVTAAPAPVVAPPPATATAPIQHS